METDLSVLNYRIRFFAYYIILSIQGQFPSLCLVLNNTYCPSIVSIYVILSTQGQFPSLCLVHYYSYCPSTEYND